MKLRFLSAKIRQATDVCRHVARLLNAQRDLLAPPAIEAVSGAIRETEAVMGSGAADEEVAKRVTELEKAADKWIKPYPHPEWRENIEVFLVAIVVAMAVRTFFLQPFKIPTGSMQPTLYGVTVQDLHDKPEVKIPGALGRIYEAAVHGEIYHEIIAAEDCRVLGVGDLKHPLPFLNKQDLFVEYADGRREAFTVWCGPDDPNAWADTGVFLRGIFHKGEAIARFVEKTGDHLFVDRVSYNFRRPERGEIIVFKTRGIAGIAQQDQFYIKRLVGLPGETVTIGTDQHVRINGQRLDASTPHFANVYGFKPGETPRKDHYSGHLLDSRSSIALPTDSLQVRPGHYVVFWGQHHEQRGFSVLGRFAAGKCHRKIVLRLLAHFDAVWLGPHAPIGGRSSQAERRFHLLHRSRQRFAGEEIPPGSTRILVAKAAKTFALHQRAAIGLRNILVGHHPFVGISLFHDLSIARFAKRLQTTCAKILAKFAQTLVDVPETHYF